MRNATFTAFLEPEDHVQLIRHSGSGYTVIKMYVNGNEALRLFTHNPGDLRDFPTYDSKHPLITSPDEKAVHSLP